MDYLGKYFNANGLGSYEHVFVCQVPEGFRAFLSYIETGKTSFYTFPVRKSINKAAQDGLNHMRKYEPRMLE